MPASYGASSMSSFFTSAVLASSLFSVGGLGHLYMSSPKPMQGNAIKDPLEASGSNFPCHGVSLPTSGGDSMQAGSSQLLAFDVGAQHQNTAVHGGGSCQMSLLYDVSKAKDPTAWSVIYSIEGGCPTNSQGNLDGGADSYQGGTPGAYQCDSPDQKNCVRSYNYTIPKGVKSGNAILAWTWFNSIGNREMYMDCANVNIQGGDSSEMDSLPPMYVANLNGINTCTTPQQKGYAFPNPGKYATTPSGYYPLATLASDCGAGSGAGAGASSPAQPTGSSQAGGYSAAPSSSAYAAPTGAASAGPYQPAASLTTLIISSAPAATSSPAAAAPSAAAPSASAPAAAPYASGSASGNASSGGVSCSQDGAVVCIGSNQFGLCNHGTAVPQPLAPGTTCKGGVISPNSPHVRRHARELGHNVHLQRQ